LDCLGRVLALPDERDDRVDLAVSFLRSRRGLLDFDDLPRPFGLAGLSPESFLSSFLSVLEPRRKKLRLGALSLSSFLDLLLSEDLSSFFLSPGRDGAGRLGRRAPGPPDGPPDGERGDEVPVLPP
jgi:hypothetical protein